MSSLKRMVVFAIRKLLLVLHERQHRHRTGPLDRGRDASLVLGGNSGNAARHDLPTLGHELPQQIYVLPIHVIRNNLTRTTALVAAWGLVTESLIREIDLPLASFWSVKSLCHVSLPP